jgi:hypothetical protein
MRGVPTVTVPSPPPRHPHGRHAADHPHPGYGRPGGPAAPGPWPASPYPPPVWPPQPPDPDVGGRRAGPHTPTRPPRPASDREGPLWQPAGGGHGSFPHPTVDPLPDLRNKVVNRLYDMSWNQAVTAWRRRHSDPLNPHVLVFLFAEPPTGTPPRCGLRVAARVLPAGDERRLPLLLYEMVPVVRDHVRAGRDLDEFVFSWSERRSPDARRAGVGVCTLDTPAGAWDEVQRSASSDMEVPGRCYAYLADGSMLLLDRLARDHFGQCQVWTTHPVWDVSGELRRPTRPAPDLATSTAHGPDNPATWQWLAALHDTLSEVDRAH